MLTYSTHAFAQIAPFVITSPAAGSVFSPGQAVTVQWTGGVPAWSLTLYVIDNGPNQVAFGVTGIPNSGSFVYALPSSFPSGGPCGHTYRFYVENVQRTSWAYGNVFSVVCPPDLAALTARVAKLEGDIVAADLAGTYAAHGIDTPLSAQIPGARNATIESDVFTGTATLNADGTGSLVLEAGGGAS